MREYAKGKHNIRITTSEFKNGFKMKVDILKTCGTCVFLVTNEGKPYYCAKRDLYTLREEDDLGCEDWQEG